MMDILVGVVWLAAVAGPGAAGVFTEFRIGVYEEAVPGTIGTLPWC
jgi:hypothetical protein